MDHRSPEALRAERLTKTFGGITALDDVSLSIPAGERRGLIGPNGAGKTTLFNSITGEIPPDHGRVSLFGEDVTHLSVQQRARLGIGRTYQVTNLFLDLTVEENLFLASGGSVSTNVLKPWRRNSARLDRAREVAEFVGLGERISAKVDALGHGEQRQLEIGVALAARPRLLMLDEPVAGLAPSERQRMMRFLGSLDRSVTLLLVEHDMDVVLGLADRVTVLHNGRVIADGAPDVVRADARVQEVYMGEWVNHG
ncbi:MAG: ABC transporter ATP-binding protein [Armatimonadetes bacterium]|nr:ABC transporter ATP-binding protein [Armatimonadota bacterium]